MKLFLDEFASWKQIEKKDWTFVLKKDILSTQSNTIKLFQKYFSY
jgi:hypothetical protein